MSSVTPTTFFTQGENPPTVSEWLKDAAIWAGHMIKQGFEKLGEVLKEIWDEVLPWLKTGAEKTWEGLRTPIGVTIIPFTVAIGCGALGIIGIAFSPQKPWIGIAFLTASAACFVLGGIAIGLGIAWGPTTQLF